MVLSTFIYNNKTGLCLCVPCTTKAKDYPFEVELSGERNAVALADQVKCIAWRVRNVAKKGRATEQELDVVGAKVKALAG